MLKSLSIFLYYGKGTLVWNEVRVVKGTQKNKIGSHRWRGRSSSDGNVEGLLERIFGLKMKNKGTCKKVLFL